jgi:hypothetical protein
MTSLLVVVWLKDDAFSSAFCLPSETTLHVSAKDNTSIRPIICGVAYEAFSRLYSGGLLRNEQEELIPDITFSYVSVNGVMVRNSSK